MVGGLLYWSCSIVLIIVFLLDGALQECSALKAQISQLVEAHRVEIEQLAQNNKAKLEGLAKSLNDGFEESKQWRKYR